MTVLQTARWVWTLCLEKGWGKGDVYAGNFFSNGMTGDLLENLDLEILEKELGIDYAHSRELLSVIQALYTTPPWIQRNIGSEPGPSVPGTQSMCGSIQLGCQVLPSHSDMDFESGRNFQNCHKTCSTVAGKSDSSYRKDMDISELSVSSFDH